MTDIKEAIEGLKRAEKLIQRLIVERNYWQAKAEYAEGKLRRMGLPTQPGDHPIRYFGEVPL